MKKILIVFDGTHFSEGSFEFASKLNELEPVLLTGVFIPQLSYAGLWSYTDGIYANTLVPLNPEDDTEALTQNINRFEEACRQNHIAFKVHKDFYDFALPELKKETRFADLLIISSETFYKDAAGGDMNDYMKEALHSSECPVIVIPEKFHFPEKVILAYDGTESSVYAIKQFAYLVPQLCLLETIVFFSEKEEDKSLPEETYINELLSQHFGNFRVEKIGGNSKKEISNWLETNENGILVSGSFGRSFFSQLFKDSFVSKVIAGHKLPVFIAHK